MSPTLRSRVRGAIFSPAWPIASASSKRFKWAYHCPSTKTAPSSYWTSTTSSRLMTFTGTVSADEVLRVVASRRCECLEGEGVVARLAPDQFGISFATARTAMLRRGWRDASSMPSPAHVASRAVGQGRHKRRGPRSATTRTRNCYLLATATEPRPCSGKPTWRCTGPRPRAAGATDSSTASWTTSCRRACVSKARSRMPSPMARSFRITSRWSTSEPRPRSATRCWRDGNTLSAVSCYLPISFPLRKTLRRSATSPIHL